MNYAFRVFAFNPRKVNAKRTPPKVGRNCSNPSGKAKFCSTNRPWKR